MTRWADLDFLQPAPAAPATTTNNFRSFTTFVDGSTQTVHLGVWNPNTYVERNPDLAVIHQISRSGDLDTRSVAIPEWNRRGPADTSQATHFSDFRTVATNAETGTEYGSAWDHRRAHISTTAYAKAYTRYGPGGDRAERRHLGPPDPGRLRRCVLLGGRA